MTDHKCHCVFARPTEEELVTVPGPTPGTAIRVQVESSAEGYVRLEHLAYTEGMGWYVQKSFVIPGEMLSALLPQLRKADCLIPKRRKNASPVQAGVMRLVPVDEVSGDETVQSKAG